MAEFLWIFWSFSLLGWVLERLFAAVTRSPRRRRRCLLLLPLCPVYGLGMAAVLALPPSLRSEWPLYLWGGLTATSVEYIYHWWGETFLGVSFWDYTGVFGNLRGRVCLPFSLAWSFPKNNEEICVCSVSMTTKARTAKHRSNTSAA